MRPLKPESRKDTRRNPQPDPGIRYNFHYFNGVWIAQSFSTSTDRSYWKNLIKDMFPDPESPTK